MKAIVAMDSNRVIGYKGRVPWYYPEDLAFFKRMTGIQDLFTGRSTFESIGKPLPDRFTYILTGDPSKYRSAAVSLPQCTYITGEQLITWIRDYPVRMEKTWLCGGAKVFEKFLPFCTEIYVTHLTEEYDGDTYMPEFESMFPEPEIIRETKNFTIARYTRGGVPLEWRLLQAGESANIGDRYESNGLWFPVEIITPADLENPPRVIRYVR